MHDATNPVSYFRLAIAPGVSSSRLSKLLALQRAEEPELTMEFFEVKGDDLAAGLREGRFDVGMSLGGLSTSSVSSQPLWCERMAAVVPMWSSLADEAKLTIDELLDYPVFRWPAEVCSMLDRRILSASPGHMRDIRDVTSFEMMALWVAAGYGVGVSAHSRIAPVHGWGICLRPLTDRPYEIITYLMQPSARHNPISERFHRRAQQVAEAERT